MKKGTASPSSIKYFEPFDIGIYARPDYYFQYDNPGFQDLIQVLQSHPEYEPVERFGEGTYVLYVKR